MTEGNSYSQILRASSIVGGAQAANYLISFARVKIVAILLGTAGVGLVSLYGSAMDLLGVVAGMGIGSSGVREIVRAYSNGSAEEGARVVAVLRRLCLATGVFGWALAILLCQPISVVMTGSPEHAGAIALLGSTLFFRAMGSGQMALLQGLRRIGDLARANVLSALTGSIVTVLIYFAFGKAGIAPAMIAAALVSLAYSWWFAARVKVAPLYVSWREASHVCRRLIGLGLSFMWVAMLVAGLDMLTRTIITRKFGVEAAGIYQAAWALSGIFANFVLSAMGTDFYPRLTGVIHDRAQASRTVNEQTEIGVLLALPGLLAVIAFAPLAIRAFYTHQFLAAADLLPWMALGLFGQIISWPMGFIQLAAGASRWFAVVETIFVATQAALTLWMVQRYGVIGAAYAFATIYALYVAAMLWVSWVLIGFSWSREARKLILVSAVFVGATFATRFLPSSDAASLVAGGALTSTSALLSLRGLAKRLGAQHRLIQLILATSVGRFFISTEV